MAEADLVALKTGRIAGCKTLAILEGDSKLLAALKATFEQRNYAVETLQVGSGEFTDGNAIAARLKQLEPDAVLAYENLADGRISGYSLKHILTEAITDAPGKGLGRKIPLVVHVNRIPAPSELHAASQYGYGLVRSPATEQVATGNLRSFCESVEGKFAELGLQVGA